MSSWDVVTSPACSTWHNHLLSCLFCLTFCLTSNLRWSLEEWLSQPMSTGWGWWRRRRYRGHRSSVRGCRDLCDCWPHLWLPQLCIGWPWPLRGHPWSKTLTTSLPATCAEVTWSNPPRSLSACTHVSNTHTCTHTQSHNSCAPGNATL